MLNRSAALRQFPDSEDKLLFAKVLDCYEAAHKKGVCTFSDFLNPKSIDAFLRVINAAYAYGGYENAERKMIGFAPDNESLPDEEFPIMTLAVTYNGRFSKSPGHRDYLGSILGLGLDRNKLGDIRLAENGAVIYVNKDIAEYISYNLEQVGNVKVKIKLGQLLPGLSENGAITRINVASLRLDAVVSGAFRLSRGKSSSLIKGEKVFVNWKPIVKASKLLEEGDIVTVRGIGRIKVETEAKRTKKDRIILEVIKY